MLVACREEIYLSSLLFVEGWHANTRHATALKPCVFLA
jgi:hypothetical protein